MNINIRNKISFFEVHWDMNCSWYVIKSTITPFGRYRIWSRDQLQFISQCTSKNDILFLKWRAVTSLFTRQVPGLKSQGNTSCTQRITSLTFVYTRMITYRIESKKIFYKTLTNLDTENKIKVQNLIWFKRREIESLFSIKFCIPITSLHMPLYWIVFRWPNYPVLLAFKTCKVNK